MAIMGLALLAYVVLDGYDLGVGILLPFASDAEKDVMVSSIGPFWDANETWLVLGVGVLLVAFPMAQGVVLSALYLPVTVMLLGLVLRGVAFDFRVKARDAHKATWNRIFAGGSLVTALAQGWMLGAYVTGFQDDLWGWLFAAGIALTLPAAYALLGAGWLLMKAEGDLQRKAATWGRRVLWPMGLALARHPTNGPWPAHRARAAPPPRPPRAAWLPEPTGANPNRPHWPLPTLPVQRLPGARPSCGQDLSPSQDYHSADLRGAPAAPPALHPASHPVFPTRLPLP